MTREEELEAEVKQLRAEMDAIILWSWEMRGLFKGLSGRIEKEMEPVFTVYLARKKDEGKLSHLSDNTNS